MAMIDTRCRCRPQSKDHNGHRIPQRLCADTQTEFSINFGYTKQEKSSATNMREPPSDFSIRQRFMRLIPAEIRNRMLDRGLFAEYLSLAQLQKHSRAIIEGRKNYHPVGGEATATRAPTASRAISPTTSESGHSGTSGFLAGCNQPVIFRGQGTCE